MKKVTVTIGNMIIETECQMDIEVREIFDYFENSTVTTVAQDIKPQVHIEVGPERLQIW